MRLLLLGGRPEITASTDAALHPVDVACGTLPDMFRFWESFTRPLLDAAEPAVIVEVGAFEGAHTRLLSEWAGGNATIHSIDPDPAFDPAELAAVHVHRAPSLDVLAEIHDPDVVLIDGDHNWYTVFHELKALETAGPAYPLVLLHDVGWPYGRRDLYDAPERIPDEFRHPFGTGGMEPGRSELVDHGGFNAGMHHAVYEGGPRNGVLTAVEDFCDQSSRDLELVTVPGLFGYGILTPVERMASRPRLAETVDAIRPSASQRRHLEALEWWRVMASV